MGRQFRMWVMVGWMGGAAACSGSEGATDPGEDVGQAGAEQGGAGASAAGKSGAPTAGKGGAAAAGKGGTSSGGSASGGTGGSVSGQGGSAAAGEGGSEQGGEAGAGEEGGAAGEAGASGQGGGDEGGAAGEAGAAGSAGAPVEDVVIAAAGDISNTEIGGQKITANLILAGDYDAVLTLGDNQYNEGTLSAYNNYFDKTWGKFFKKLRPVPGNHEYNTPGAAGYYKYFGSLAGDPKKGYYSYDLGAWHIIAINSNSECGAIKCNAGSAQEKWLRADLAAHKNKCTLAYWHHPRFSSGEHGNSPEMIDLWKALYEFNADVVLNGHDHDYERFAPQDPAGNLDMKKGIVEFVVGTGGTGFRAFEKEIKNSVKKQAKTFGVLKMVLKAQSYSFEFIGEEGSTFEDKGNRECH